MRVTLYEAQGPSGHGLFMYADDGKIVFETNGERGRAAEEMAHVAIHSWDDDQWPAAQQQSWFDGEAYAPPPPDRSFPPAATALWRDGVLWELRDRQGEVVPAIAEWHDGVLTVVGPFGTMGEVFLDLPASASGIYTGLSPFEIRRMHREA